MKKYRIVVAGRSFALGVALYIAFDPRGVRISAEPFMTIKEAYAAIRKYIAVVDIGR